MAIPTPEELKAHLRVNLDDEDDLIEHYLDAAKILFQNITNKTLVDSSPETGELVCDALIKQALLLLASSWYRSRENDTDKPLSVLPYGFASVVNQYREWSEE